MRATRGVLRVSLIRAREREREGGRGRGEEGDRDEQTDRGRDKGGGGGGGGRDVLRAGAFFHSDVYDTRALMLARVPVRERDT